MYFAILRNRDVKEKPPAILKADLQNGLAEGIIHYEKTGWECVVIIEGESLDIDTFLQQYSFSLDNTQKNR